VYLRQNIAQQSNPCVVTLLTQPDLKKKEKLVAPYGMDPPKEVGQCGILNINVAVAGHEQVSRAVCMNMNVTVAA
jgi:hypothetical protein